MSKMRKFCSLVMTLVLAMSLAVPAFAAVSDTGFSDVAADDWYAEAAMYVRDSGVMNGTGAAAFGSDLDMTRAMLVTVLYRAAGSPAVTGSHGFTDVADDAYYNDAVIWAAQNAIVAGYGNGLFGSDDPVSREQIAAILWRYDGSKQVEFSASFTDSVSIDAYAVEAVDWAAANGIVAGMPDGSFAPRDSATRAQVAVMLYRYLTAGEAQQPETPEETGRVLIAYFSATGNTEGIARHIEAVTGGTLYEIVPEIPYTSADLNYSDSNSRSQVEQRDANARPAISGGVENMADYDVIFLGYPIWNGQAPRIISTFLERSDLSGKTVVPFCTSASSGIGSSAANLHTLAPDAAWLDGSRFSGSAGQTTVEAWVSGLGLGLGAAA